MKRSVFVLAASLIVFTFNHIFAQSFAIDKGSKLIAGSFSIRSAGGDLYGSSKDGRSTSIMLYGDFGYFVSKGINVGAKVLFNRYSHGNLKSTGWGIGPSFSYYFGDEKSALYPYLSVSFFYNKTTVSYENDIAGGNYEDSQDGSLTHFAGGVCYMLSNAVGMFSEVNYEIENLNFNNTSLSGNSINLMVGIKAFLF